MRIETLIPLDGKSFKYVIYDKGMKITGHLSIKTEFALVLTRHYQTLLEDKCELIPGRKGGFYLSFSKFYKWCDLITPLIAYKEIKTTLNSLKEKYLLSYEEEIKDEMFLNLIK